jgi:hypothetical protein
MPSKQVWITFWWDMAAAISLLSFSCAADLRLIEIATPVNSQAGMPASIQLRKRATFSAGQGLSQGISPPASRS